MVGDLRSVLSDAWPFLGSLYLLYLAFQAPPVRYVGIGGLAVVTPLLFGWTVGRLFGIGPWADGGSGGEDGSEREAAEATRDSVE